jgi:transcription antitermination factor NusG
VTYTKLTIMPILHAEPQLYPDQLFEPDREACSQRTWWVLHTKPRQEKSLARQLHGQGIPYYLPLVQKRLRVRNRLQTSYHPLFGGYLFLLADADERLAALATQRIVRVLEVPDQNGLWCDLAQIQRLIRSGVPIVPEDRLAPGTLVEIRTGPLAGLRGKIQACASRRRFVVEVNFIHRGASILLEDFTLTPVIE